MIVPLIIASITCIALILSVLFCPMFRIAHVNIRIYPIIALIGAIFMIIFGSIDFNAYAYIPYIKE